jgi:hypothetical protein
MGANEMSLAWSLVDVAAPQLDNAARTWTCTQIGAGESRTAIENILRVIAPHQLCLSVDLAVQLYSWLSGFHGSDCEKTLRRFPEQIPVKTFDGSNRNVIWVR